MESQKEESSDIHTVVLKKTRQIECQINRHSDRQVRQTDREKDKQSERQTDR